MRLTVCILFAVFIAVCASQKANGINVKSKTNTDSVVKSDAKSQQNDAKEKIITESKEGTTINPQSTSTKINAKTVNNKDPGKNKNTESKDKSYVTTNNGNNEGEKNTEQKERSANPTKQKSATNINVNSNGPEKNKEPEELGSTTFKPKLTSVENFTQHNTLKNADGTIIRNILAVLPYQGRSHHMFFQSVLRILLEEGHQVKTFTTVLLEEDFKNHEQILFQPSITSWADLFEFDYQTSQTSWELRSDLDKLAESFLFPLYELDEFRKLLNGNDQFDMVLLEPFFMQEPLVFLGKRFKCPVVSLATAAPESIQDSFMGRPRNPALEPEWTTCAPQPTMNFFQRTANTFSWLVNALEHRFFYLPKREADMKRLLPYHGLDSLPPMSEMLSDISLTLSNSHQLVHSVNPVPPNLIFTPGLHIKENVVLPQDFQILMDNAKHGVIYFTMGTMIPVSKMKSEREVFIETFSKLPQLVLWKSDIEIPNLPSNVKTFKWFPQQAVLAHKNCKLFITHGGMLSKQEAVYNRVPLVSIPLFGDQPMNTGHSQATGLGITVPFKNITLDNLYNAITTVINDDQFSKRMENNSKIFKEAVARSRSSALYWMNHVMEYDGADYLRKKHELKWFQFYLLDVIALFVLIIVSTISLLFKCAQGLCSLRFPKRSQNIKIKKQ